MLKKTLILALGLLAVLAAPAAAGVAPDGYQPPSIQGQDLGNGNVRVTGTGCPANSPISYSVRRGAPPGNGPVILTGTATADADGNFDFVVGPLPNGQLTITVTCGSVVQVLGVNLSSGAITPSSSLPRTGDDSSLPLARVGAFLVAAGGLTVYAARKRRHSGPAASV